MRVHARGRTKLLAAAASGVLVLTAAGCGDDGGGGGGDDNTVTIWSSLDQPVQDGLEKALVAKAEAEDITIKWEKVENINQLIMTRIQAGETPDIAFIPQPGVVADMVELDAARPLD